MVLIYSDTFESNRLSSTPIRDDQALLTFQ